MQSFFFIFFHLQKIAPQIAKKADNTPTPHPPHDRPPQRKYRSHRDTSHTRPSCTAHPVPGPATDPGPLIQALIFSLYHVRRYSATQGTAHPVRWRYGSSWTASGAVVDRGSLILSGGSLIRMDPSSCGHPSRLILDGGSSCGPSRRIPMHPMGHPPR